MDIFFYFIFTQLIYNAPLKHLSIDYYTLIQYQIKYLLNFDISVFTDTVKIFLRNFNVVLGCFWATYHIKNNIINNKQHNNIVNLYKLLSYLVPIALGIVIGHTTAKFYEKIGNNFFSVFLTSIITMFAHGIIELTTIALISYILFFKVYKELYNQNLNEKIIINKINESYNNLYNHLIFIAFLFATAAFIEAKSSCGSLYYLFLLNSQ